jgi:hypothetical protein
VTKDNIASKILIYRDRGFVSEVAEDYEKEDDVNDVMLTLSDTSNIVQSLCHFLIS